MIKGNVINSYILYILKPRLESYNISSDVINIVSDDISDRLASALFRWNDIENRRTIIFSGYEEAFFYEPAVDLDIRALIVISIRNSMIEDLCSTKEAARSVGLLKPAFSDDDVVYFTREAITHFSQYDLLEESKHVGLGKTDPFGRLHELYPVTWEAIKHLADFTSQYHIYNPLIMEPFDLEPDIEPFDLVKSIKNKKSDIRSGMDPNIDKMLLSMLQQEEPFISDSFKSITRNPDKLYKVFEFVLRKNRAILTSNFYITNGYVCRRKTMLKPGHDRKDMENNLHNFYGLRKTHKDALQAAMNYIDNN